MTLLSHAREMDNDNIRRIAREEALNLIRDFHHRLNGLRTDSISERTSELIAVHKVIDEMREEVRGKEGTT